MQGHLTTIPVALLLMAPYTHQNILMSLIVCPGSVDITSGRIFLYSAMEADYNSRGQRAMSTRLNEST
jgi:hypothetical protein